MNPVQDLVTHSESSQSATNYPCNTQAPEITLGSDVLFQPPSLDTQRQSFDMVVNLSFSSPQCRTEARVHREKETQQDGSLQLFLGPTYRLYSETLFQQLIMKGKLHKMNDQA